MAAQLTELLGSKLPIMQGGMQWVGTADLAAAVSNAGGLGTITARTLPTYESLCQEIAYARTLTPSPIAVNISISQSQPLGEYDQYIQAVIDMKVPIVETAGNNPRGLVAALKPHGVVVIHKCTSLQHALSAERIGVDVVSIDGFEAAGHPGENDTPLFIILPIVARHLTVPVIASGGIATGGGVAAALALGADGVNMGTRFMLTEESPIHPLIKEHLLTLTELDTDLIARSIRRTGRYARNAITQAVREIEATTRDVTYGHFAELISGTRGRQALSEGDWDYGLVCASQALGLINDAPSVRLVVDRLLAEYRDITLAELGAN